MRSHTCPKCQSSMSEGFMLGERYGMPTVIGWMEGAPKKGFWGLKLTAKPIEISTWRCQRCGYLENYARR